MTERVPVLRWSDVADGRRLLFAGNQPAAVASCYKDAEGWHFEVALPGSPLSYSGYKNRTAGEAFVSGVVEAWFKELWV